MLFSGVMSIGTFQVEEERRLQINLAGVSIFHPPGLENPGYRVLISLGKKW
jgi:hypothetical protein